MPSLALAPSAITMLANPRPFVTKVYTFHQLVYVVGYFWYQAYLCATADCGMQRDPPGIAPHHFHDHHAVVALSR